MVANPAGLLCVPSVPAPVQFFGIIARWRARWNDDMFTLINARFLGLSGKQNRWPACLTVTCGSAALWRNPRPALPSPFETHNHQIQVSGVEKAKRTTRDGMRRSPDV